MGVVEREGIGMGVIEREGGPRSLWLFSNEKREVKVSVGEQDTENEGGYEIK
jgi:hypothetical protein